MRSAVAMALVAAFSACAVADEVRIRNIAYPPGSVLGVTDGSLVYETLGRRINASMADVQTITLTGQIAYNEVEALLAAGKHVEAAEAFEKLAGSTDSDRIKQLSLWRAMGAYEKGGELGKSVGLWVTFLRQSPSPGLLNLRPKTVAQRGSQANAQAITHLEAALAEHTSRTVIADGLRSALVDLYTVQGDTGKAMAMLDAMTVAAPQPRAGQPPEQTAPTAGGAVLVRRAALLMEEKKYSDALAAAQESLKTLRSEELAGALMLSGKARLALAGQADQDQSAAAKYRVAAGLDFMRVSIYWPGVPEAAEAMWLAGEVCAALGNDRAAYLVYQRLIEKHPDAPWAKQAKEKSDAMDLKR